VEKVSSKPFAANWCLLFSLRHTQAIAIGTGAKTPFFSYFASVQINQHHDFSSIATATTY
jgi:hypothetical protein